MELTKQDLETAELLRKGNIKGSKMWLGCPSLHYQRREARRDIKAYENMTPEEILMTHQREAEIIHREAVNYLKRLKEYEKHQREHPSELRFGSVA